MTISRYPDNRLTRHAFLLVPLLLSLVIGLWGIGARPLWTDELFTADAVENGLSGLWAHSWEAPLLPYYALMYLWTVGGQFTGDVWMRLLSVLFAGAAVALTALAGRNLAGRAAGFVAAFVVAASPTLAYYSQNARSYTLGTLLVAAANLVVTLYVQSGTQRRIWWLYAFVVTCAAVFVQTALLFLPVHAIVLPLLTRSLSVLRQWLASVAVTSPVLLGALALFVSLGPKMHGWLAKPSFSDLWDALPQVTRWGPYVLIVLSAAVLTRLGWIWLSGLAGGIATVWIISQFAASFWLDGVLGMLIPVLGLAAAGITTLVSLRFAALWCALLLVISASYLYHQQTRTDPKRVSQAFVESVTADGEPVRFVGAVRGDLKFALRHYAPAIPVDYLSEDDTVVRPYWSTQTGGDACPGGKTFQLDASTWLTRCP